VQGWQVIVGAVGWQSPLMQSPSERQVSSLAHGAQSAPPQSTAVSLPFLTLSKQLGAAQVTPSHCSLPGQWLS